MVVDGRDTHAEIASFCVKKYQELYTPISYDSNCMNDIFSELDDLLAVMAIMKLALSHLITCWIQFVS